MSLYYELDPADDNDPPLLPPILTPIVTLVFPGLCFALFFVLIEQEDVV